MRADFLPFERCARLRGQGSVFGDETLDRIAAELSAAATEKQWIFRTTVAFAQPGIQHRCRFWTERCAPMFSALSLAVDMSASSQDDILAAQANQLGDPEPRLDGKQKHRSIPAPNPDGTIRCCQQSVDLFPVEECDGPTFVAFGGHRQDSLAEQRMGRLL